MADNETPLEEVIAGYQEQITALTEERDALQKELDKHNEIVQRILNGGDASRPTNSKRDAFIASCNL